MVDAAPAAPFTTPSIIFLICQSPIFCPSYMSKGLKGIVTITASGDSDDTFSVHLATSSPTAACLDDDDCSAGEWRWLMIELPTGGGLQLGAKYAIAGGWFMGAAPLDEDKPSPPMTMQQDGYSMVLTLAIPAGTRLSLWRGADDDVVL